MCARSPTVYEAPVARACASHERRPALMTNSGLSPKGTWVPVIVALIARLGSLRSEVSSHIGIGNDMPAVGNSTLPSRMVGGACSCSDKLLAHVRIARISDGR